MLNKLSKCLSYFYMRLYDGIHYGDKTGDVMQYYNITTYPNPIPNYVHWLHIQLSRGIAFIRHNNLHCNKQFFPVIPWLP